MRVLQERLKSITPLSVLFLFILALAFACASRPSVDPQPRFSYRTDVQDADIRSDLEALGTHVETYFNRYGQLPDRLPLLRDTPDGQPIIAELPRDPWGVPYVLRRLGDEVVIFSTGPDLIAGSQDDVALHVELHRDGSLVEAKP